jgi:aspartokinase
LATNAAAFVDARDFLVTDDQFACERPFPRRTAARGRIFAALPPRVRSCRSTGFIGATADGQTTTIGRNGSTTARPSLRRGRASVIEIWTDVDGVLSADPRIVPAALRSAERDVRRGDGAVAYSARGPASATIAPAVAKRIHPHQNTFNLTHRDAISRQAADDGKLAKGITSVGDHR